MSGAAPDLTHFASRGVFAGSVFDLWVDTDGNGEVDIDELGGSFNVADLKAWLRDPPGAEADGPDQGARACPTLSSARCRSMPLVAYLQTLE